MKNKKKLFTLMVCLLLLINLVINPTAIKADETEKIITIEQEDGSVVTMIPLSQEETDLLVEQSKKQTNLPKLQNEVFASPVKTGSNFIAVDFTNRGFILDFVDYVETNLLIWHAMDDNIVGYKMAYYRLPSGTHRTKPVYVADWRKAQLIGGFYIDGFGTEIGVGTASGFIYNN